jgi:chromodomain-helicase-DNA-binding protein 1
MNSTISLPHVNGHHSPLTNSVLTNDDAPYDSESDLSEVANHIIEDPSPATSPNHQSEFGVHDADSSDSSGPEDEDGSDDADFDMEESPVAEQTNGGRHERSTSSESRRPAKRKLGVEEDEYILANPELYGLRRSVRISFRETKLPG